MLDSGGWPVVFGVFRPCRNGIAASHALPDWGEGPIVANPTNDRFENSTVPRHSLPCRPPAGRRGRECCLTQLWWFLPPPSLCFYPWRGRECCLTSLTTDVRDNARFYPWRRRECCLTKSSQSQPAFLGFYPWRRRECCLTKASAPIMCAARFYPWRRRECCLTRNTHMVGILCRVSIPGDVGNAA